MLRIIGKCTSRHLFRYGGFKYYKHPKYPPLSKHPFLSPSVVCLFVCWANTETTKVECNADHVYYSFNFFFTMIGTITHAILTYFNEFVFLNTYIICLLDF